MLARFIYLAVIIVTALLGGLAALLSKEVRHAIGDAAEWLYPFGVIVVFLVALVVLLVIVVRERRKGMNVQAHAESGQHLEKDAATYKTIIGVLTRADVEYWRDLDFGGVWYGSRTHKLMELLYNHNAVENQFFDKQLEKLRGELMNATDKLMEGCAYWGAAHRMVPNGYELGDAEWVRDNPPEGERYERFETRRTELGKRADQLVSSYDALVGAARARLPGV